MELGALGDVCILREWDWFPAVEAACKRVPNVIQKEVGPMYSFVASWSGRRFAKNNKQNLHIGLAIHNKGTVLFATFFFANLSVITIVVEQSIAYGCWIVSKHVQLRDLFSLLTYVRRRQSTWLIDPGIPRVAHYLYLTKHPNRSSERRVPATGFVPNIIACVRDPPSLRCVMDITKVSDIQPTGMGQEKGLSPSNIPSPPMLRHNTDKLH